MAFTKVHKFFARLFCSCNSTAGLDTSDLEGPAVRAVEGSMSSNYSFAKGSEVWQSKVGTKHSAGSYQREIGVGPAPNKGHRVRFARTEDLEEVFVFNAPPRGYHYKFETDSEDDEYKIIGGS